MTLTRDQTIVADIVLAALDGRSADMCRLINALPRRQHADAGAKSLDLMASIFRTVISPTDWAALIQEARLSVLALDLPEDTP